MTPNVARTLLVLTLLPFGVLSAQQPDTVAGQLSPEATLKTTARAVVLDVVVTDAKGHPVHGLNASDFVLLEDGVAQHVASLQEHIPDAVSAPMPKSPPNYFTNVMPAATSDSWTVILIDALNNTPIAQDYVHGQLTRFMKTVPAGHPVAIFEMDTSGTHLIQGFTSDPDVLLKAMESKRDETEFTLRREPGRRAYVTPQGTSAGLQAMGRYLAGFPGRKNLVWLSGSIPDENWGAGFRAPFPDREDFSPGLEGVGEALELNRVAVYPIDVRGLTPDTTYGGATSGIPGNTSHAAFGENRVLENGYLQGIAERTGGKAFVNSNGLRDALSEVIQTGSDYYTLAYSPANKNWDGQRRNIAIESSRSDLKLEYRHGYIASPEPTQKPAGAVFRRTAAQAGSMTKTYSAYRPVAMSAGGFNATMALGAIPATEVLFGVSVTAGKGTQKLDKNAPQSPGNYLPDSERGKGFRNYSILYRITPDTLRLTPTAEGLHEGEVQLVVVVYDDKGEQVNSEVSTRKFSLTETQYLGVTRGGGLTLSETVAVPAKGSYFFRFGVHDLVADHSGSLEVPADNVQMAVVGPGQQPIP